MDRSLTAALLSGLVFPGAGQFYLKRRLRACVFLVPTVAAAAWFVRNIMAKVEGMLDQINNGTLAPDPFDIAARLHAQGEVASPLVNVCATVLVVFWIASIVDAYLLGRNSPAKDVKPT